MKKLILLLTILCILCGCGKKTNPYANFKHYTLDEEEKNYYTYINENGVTEVYVIADITPPNYESKVAGLFYKLSDNDYILLDEFENGELLSKESNFQYENKLYVTACNSMCHYEYTLKGDKTTKKDLDFDVSEVGKQITIYYPQKVDKDNVYYYTRMYDSSLASEYWGKEYLLKCDLKTYKCIVEQEL